ncbi:MAG: FAD-binding protein [Chloroflexi bacterium]|nr:FAD-binding protein [Chloroflexota bacterium]
MSQNQPRQAIVIGASMAGLLAARVLADHFDRVLVLDRDALPDTPEYRSGTPQARHLHLLLARGEQVLNELFPGIEAEFAARGAQRASVTQDAALYTLGGLTPRHASDLHTYISARISLEWMVRQRVAQIPNVRFLTEVTVKHLTADDTGQTVTGVVVESRGHAEPDTIEADFVVDASGRGSQARAWLQALGYDAPAETVINGFQGYATRWYRRPVGVKTDLKGIGIQARPTEGNYRSGGFVEIDDERMIVTLMGANKDYPPTDEAEFLEYARTLATPFLYDLIKDAEPLSPIYGYRRTENRFVHYEQMTRRPEAFVVMGDAACAFNPTYGQGMTVAALEALELQAVLRAHGADQLDGVAAEFQTRLAKVAQGAWLLATGEDMSFPETVGGRPTLPMRVAQLYIRHLLTVGAQDEAISYAFMRVMQLVDQPAALFRPQIVLRVLLRTVVRPQPLPEPTLEAAQTQTAQAV